MFKNLFLLLIALCFFGRPSFGQLIATDPAEIRKYVLDKMQEHGIPGAAVGVVRDGQLQVVEGFGVSRLGQGEIVKSQSIFHTASVSKIFTALAVLELVREGKLQLEDKLTAILPELRYKDPRVAEVSLLNVLNHTSGIPDVMGYNWGNPDVSARALENYIKKQHIKLKFSPGEKYLYSNLAYDLLAQVIEEKSGVPFESYVAEKILLPSGMLHSDFRYFNIPDSLKVSPHTKNKISGKRHPRKTYPYAREHAGSSTLNSSAYDLGKWMVHFMQAYQKDVFFQQMTAVSTPVTNRVGLGFQRYTISGQQAVGHYGGDKGFRSFLVMLPESKHGVVVLANADYNEDFREQVALDILKLLNK
jgi:CubicO group peptidase (beta-lactamase class C family)